MFDIVGQHSSNVSMVEFLQEGIACTADILVLLHQGGIDKHPALLLIRGRMGGSFLRGDGKNGKGEMFDAHGGCVGCPCGGWHDVCLFRGGDGLFHQKSKAGE